MSFLEPYFQLFKELCLSFFFDRVYTLIMNDHQKGLYAFVVISFLIRFIVFTYEVLIVLRNAQNAHNSMTH